MNWTDLFWNSELETYVVGAAIAAGVGLFLRWRLPWSLPSRKTMSQLFHGPILTAVVGFAVYALVREYVASGGAGLPSYLGPNDVLFLVELAILSAAAGFATAAVRRHSPRTSPEGRRMCYGVYAAALLALVIVILTAPGFPTFAATSWQIVGFLVGLLATYFVIHIVDLTLKRYFDTRARADPRILTLYSVVRRFVILLIAFLGVLVSAYTAFPDLTAQLTALVLAAGFLAIVVGLAAQSSLSNIIGGVLVATTQPFHIGDAVVYPYPNGDWCFVEDIRLTFTVLRTWDLRRLMVPNAMFQSSVIVNYTAVDPTMLVIVYMVITFESNVDRAREIMVEEARKHPDLLPLGNLPVTHVMDYQGGGNQGTGMYGGVDLRLLSAAKDQPTAFQVEKDLLYSIRKRFEEEGIALAYPTQRVIVDSPGGRTSGRSPRKAASDP